MSTSATNSNRKYFIAAMAVLGGLLLIVAALVALVMWAATLRVGGGSQIGSANLFVPGPFSRHYSVTAIFDVPRSPDFVHSAPSLQFELFASSAPHERFLAGLERTEESGDRLSGVVYYKLANRSGQTRYLAPLQDGPHRATIAVDDDRIRFSIDGSQAFQLRDASIAKWNVAYLTVGTNVGVGGEHAVGTISDVAIQSGAGRMRSIVPSCTVTTHGLSLVRAGGAWRVSGVNDPSASAVIHGCHDATYPKGAFPPG